jgi:hypothetical protein
VALKNTAYGKQHLYRTTKVVSYRKEPHFTLTKSSLGSMTVGEVSMLEGI